MSVIAVAPGSYVTHRSTAPTIPAAAITNGFAPSFDTAAGNRDTNFVSSAHNCVRGDNDVVVDLRTGYSDIWIHFELSISGTQSDNQVTIGTYDASGNLQLAMTSNGTAQNADFDRSTNGTTTTGTAFSGPAVTIAATTRYRFDIHFKIAASGGVVEAYVNEVLAGSVFTGDTSTNGAQNMRYVTFRAGGTSTRRYSQIIVADENTRGWKVQEAFVATGSQNFSGWTGDFSNVDDVTFSVSKFDSAFTNTVGNTVSYVTNDCTASAAAMTVRAVVACGRAYLSPDAAPTGIAPGLSIGGTFYEGATVSLTNAMGDVPFQNIWHANPSNGSGWTQADVNALQVGARAK